jgi:hypothetical protein
MEQRQICCHSHGRPALQLATISTELGFKLSFRYYISVLHHLLSTEISRDESERKNNILHKVARSYADIFLSYRRRPSECFCSLLAKEHFCCKMRMTCGLQFWTHIHTHTCGVPCLTSFIGTKKVPIDAKLRVCLGEV